MAAETGRTLDPTVLAEIVRRVVEVAQPEKVILFGSAARGEMGPHSDVDLLVVKPGEYHKRDMALDIYRGLRGVEYPVDAIVTRPEDIERYGDCFAVVYYPALREGKVIYAA